MTMKTQSPDTSLDAEAALIELIRKASIGKRFNLVRSMTKQTIWANMHYWRESHPKASEQDAAIHFVFFNYGSVLAAQVQTVLEKREQQWHEEPADLVTVMNPVIAVFEQLAIPCYLAGSAASSLHGMQQVAQDVGLVADLHDQYLDTLIPRLQRPHSRKDKARLSLPRISDTSPNCQKNYDTQFCNLQLNLFRVYIEICDLFRAYVEIFRAWNDFGSPTYTHFAYALTLKLTPSILIHLSLLAPL